MYFVPIHFSQNYLDDLVKRNIGRLLCRYLNFALLSVWALLHFNLKYPDYFFLLTRHCDIGLLFLSSMNVFSLFFLYRMIFSQISVCVISFIYKLYHLGFSHPQNYTIDIKKKKNKIHIYIYVYIYIYIYRLTFINIRVSQKFFYILICASWKCLYVIKEVKAMESTHHSSCHKHCSLCAIMYIASLHVWFERLPDNCAT